MDGLAPIFAPIQIFVGGLAVIINIIFVADVKRRIGENQIGTTFGKSIHAGDAITIDDAIDLHVLASRTP
ncbi:MAG TPA: hypothetical protein VKJ65_01645 [Phycisphaerae bacterium]|nr:hypothetical protein [Phycisphaerae bacterium]